MWTKKGIASNINRNPLLCLSWNAIALINTLFHCNCNFIPVSPFIVIQMLSTWDATKFEISEEDPHNAPYSLIEILNNDTTVRAVLQKFIEKSTQKRAQRVTILTLIALIVWVHCVRSTIHRIEEREKRCDSSIYLFNSHTRYSIRSRNTFFARTL